MGMKKKRKSETEGNDEPKEKISKQENGETIERSTKNNAKMKSFEFDVKQFRKDIKTKIGQSVSLTQFLQVCTNTRTDVDYLKQYLDSGGTPAEILRQLEGNHKKDTQLVSSVFNIMHLLFTKIQSQYPLLIQQLEETCRYFLNTFVSTIDHMLGEKSNERQQKITLQLLTVIVTLNSELAFTVLNQLSLQPKMMLHLVKVQQNVKDKDDVRKGFIFFVMSFFLEGNTTLIKSLLDKQGLLSLFVADLVKDKADIVLMVIELLKKHIVNNQSISKTIKIRTFNQTFLANIFNIFNWKVCNLKSEEGQKTKMDIDEAVFDFLLVLFTSHKQGVYFTDKYLGTGDTPTNQHLWNTIDSLDSPWNNEKAGQLIIKIISQCPDLNKPILHLVEQNFEPRHSEQWLKTLKFLINLFDYLPAKHVISLMSEMNAVQITNFVRNVYLPSKILQICNTTLTSADILLKHQIIFLLNIMLNSVKNFLMHVDSLKENQSKVKSLLTNRLEEFIPKHFPSADSLISVLHSILNGDLDKYEQNKEFIIELPKSSIFVTNIIDLLLIYNDLIPNSLDPIAIMLDSKRLLERIEFISDTDNVNKLKLKIIMFLVGADKFAFSPDKPLFNEILQTMFQVYISSDNDLYQSSRSVLYNILETTNIFERNIYEIDLLLSVVYIVGKESDNILNHIIHIIGLVLKNFSKYSEIISSLCKIENADSMYKQYVDIYFENLDNEEELGGDVVNSFERSSYTPFILGVLNYEDNTNNDLKMFIKYYLVSLYHNQEYPQSLMNVLKDHNVDFLVMKYITNWLTKPSNLSSKIVDKTTTLYKLSNVLLNDDEKLDICEILPMFLCEESETSNSFTFEYKTYTFSTNICTPFIDIYSDLVIFYTVQQHRLNQLTINKLKKSTIVLKCLLLMSSCLEDKRFHRNSIEKCLANKILIQNFSPFANGDDFVTKFIMDFVTFCSENNLQSIFVSSLLKPYRHKLYMSLLIEIKKAVETKTGVVLINAANMLSVIGLTLSDAGCIMKEILKLNINCMITNENEPSSWLHILCYIIRMFIKNSRAFSHRMLQGVSLVYFNMITNLNVVINLQEFEECFLNYLCHHPESISNVPHKVFKAIFSVKHVSKFTSNLGSLLLKTDVRLLPIFKSNIVKDDVMQKRELILPLTSAALSHNVFASNSSLIKQIYDNYKTNINKILEKPHKASQIYIDYSDFTVKLMNRCMDVKDCENYCKKVQKYETLECFHIDMLEEIHFKAYFSSKNVLYLNNYLLTILQLANVAFKKDVQQNDKFSRVAKTIQNILLISFNDNVSIDSFNAISNSAIFQNYFKNILKVYVKKDQSDLSIDENDPCLFGLTSPLIRMIYPNDHASIVEFFDMTVSHSEFLNVMLSNRPSNVKTQLVKLLLVMCLNNKEVMKANHIPIYLSSYHASMNECDRYLLCLLKLYETNGHLLNEYQPYLWGDTAANHYAVRSKRMKSSLWSNPTANHILNLFDKEMIERTIKNYPINTTLNVENDVLMNANFKFGIDKTKFKSDRDDILNKIYVKKNVLNYSSVDLNVDVVKCKMVLDNLNTTTQSQRSQSYDIYDPAFVLPLLNYVVSPSSAVSCHRIIRGGVLSIPFMALSAKCPSVRAAAFNVLHRFYVLLESEMYYKNDKILWSQFIDTLKSSLDSVQMFEDDGLKVPYLPTLGALYLAQSTLVMTQPLDSMFKPINNFVISKQHIDFTLVPDFLDLFHSTDVTFVERRTWMLCLLRDGVKTMEDIDVVLKSVVFKMILDFYSSSVCDGKQKVLILEILNACIQIPKTAKLLIDGYSIFAWFNCVFRDINPENKKLVTTAIRLVKNLWISLISETNKTIHSKMINGSDDTIFVEILSGKCLKLAAPLQLNIFYLLNSLIDKLSHPSVDDVCSFLNILNNMPVYCMKNLSKTIILCLIGVVENLYTTNNIVKSLNNIVKDSKKDNLFNILTLSQLPCGVGDERTIVHNLYLAISKWIS